MIVRFDDMAATVIAQTGAGPQARAIAWRQLVDLVAQGRTAADQADTIYGTLRAWRPSVSADQRGRAARALAGRPLPPALFAFFAEDSPAIVAPLARSVRFDAAEWRALLPLLSPPVRALLRHRDDLDPEVERALASFGAADMVIAAPDGAQEAVPEAPPPVPDSETGGVQIRALVDRIEAYRREKPLAAPPPAETAEERVESFRFETGSDGILIWIEGAPREPLIGLSIATVADAPDHGVDGHVAGAHRRRAQFRDARLSVAGHGPASGEWRISAVPSFNSSDGRFTGYRGTARRPRADEVARTTVSPGLYGSSFPPESLRQLVHELRTPLNAILGFAEMIDGQILGPAAEDYRNRAVDIAGDAKRLLGAVDDLDTAARVDTNALRLERTHIDGADLLRRICRDLAPLADERGAEIRVAIASELPPLATDPRAIERMFARLLAALVAVSARGETLEVGLGAEAGLVALSVDRPLVLRDQDERALLDPGYSPEGDWPDAPLLGLGFALRLVRNLALAAGGQFLIADTGFTLILPGASAMSDAGKGGA